MNKNNNLIMFVFRYCVGRTPLTKELEWSGRKIVNNNNPNWWNTASTRYSAQNFARDIGESSNLDGESWKQKIMDYCSKFNWNQEKFKVDNWRAAELLCTD